MNLELLNEMRHIAGLPQLKEAPLSRTDVDGNIQRILDSIREQAAAIVAAAEKNIEAPEYGAHDKWGIQGNLVHVSSSLADILQFIGGGQ